MCETNIIALHDQIPHISLPHSSFLRSRPHSRRHDVCLATPTSPPLLLLLLSLKVFLLKWRDDLFFVKEEKMAFFFFIEEKRKDVFTSKQQTFPTKTVSAFSSFARRPGTRGGSAKRCSFPFFLTRRPTTRGRRLRGGRESRDVGDCAL